jgi:ubiquinone/menaquinone biosynthesis C-methylase UbiE
MHRLHNAPRIPNGPQTTGIALHWSAHYDIFSYLLGMGPNRPNSRMVIELADVKPGSTVLDVGCGTGSLTLTAQSYAGPQVKVHGIDAAPEMIETAKKKAARSEQPVVFDVGLIEKLAFPDATFDVVISRLVIHHLPDDLKRRGFAEILRALKPGGASPDRRFHAANQPRFKPSRLGTSRFPHDANQCLGPSSHVEGNGFCRSSLRPDTLGVLGFCQWKEIAGLSPPVDNPERTGQCHEASYVPRQSLCLSPL